MKAYKKPPRTPGQEAAKRLYDLLIHMNTVGWGYKPGAGWTEHDVKVFLTYEDAVYQQTAALLQPVIDRLNKRKGLPE